MTIVETANPLKKSYFSVIFKVSFSKLHNRRGNDAGIEKNMFFSIRLFCKLPGNGTAFSPTAILVNRHEIYSIQGSN
jgi:hypothetical protein